MIIIGCPDCGHRLVYKYQVNSNLIHNCSRCGKEFIILKEPENQKHRPMNVIPVIYIQGIADGED